MVNASQLKQIAPNIKQIESAKIAPLLDKICPMYGVGSANVFHEFIANTLHESAEFTSLSENLNYSVDSLLKKFGRHRISIAEANAYGRGNGHPANQQKIANVLYGGTWGLANLGNNKSGDGWIFRGSGPIQITGRSNIENFCSYYNKKFGTTYTGEMIAELLRTNIEIGIHSACWIFAVSKNLIQAAIDDKMDFIIKKINGGLMGKPERMAYYNIAKTIIK